jgi:hypothetical protein
MGVCVMMENKITKKMRFTEIREIMAELGKTDLIAFIDHEIELIDRKAENRKMGTSKKAVENNSITELIIRELQVIGKTTITNLLKQSEPLADYVTEEGNALSNQKITALLKPLVENGKVIRTVDKKTIYYELIEQ